MSRRGTPQLAGWPYTRLPSEDTLNASRSLYYYFVVSCHVFLPIWIYGSNHCTMDQLCPALLVKVPIFPERKSPAGRTYKYLICPCRMSWNFVPNMRMCFTKFPYAQICITLPHKLQLVPVGQLLAFSLSVGD
jgi:hypothetical protein